MGRMSAPQTARSSASRVGPDDLLTLLAVARLGKYTAAAHVLGVNHTTVSRRILALEKAVGERVLSQAADGWELTVRGRSLVPAAESIEAALATTVRQSEDAATLTGTVRIACPEGFATACAVPVLAELERDNPHLHIELIAVTQRARRYRSGVDVEIVVGEPHAPHATAHRLRDYSLRLYASPDYLERSGEPVEAAELSAHRLIFYPEHSVDVEHLEHAAIALPADAVTFHSNSVTAQVAAARAGAGIGLLPDFLAEAEGTGLVRVLPDVEQRLTYWASIREEALRTPAVRAVLEAMHRC